MATLSEVLCHTEVDRGKLSKFTFRIKAHFFPAWSVFKCTQIRPLWPNLRVFTLYLSISIFYLIVIL